MINLACCDSCIAVELVFMDYLLYYFYMIIMQMYLSYKILAPSSVLVHSGGVHGGHYYAFIRPTLSDQWYVSYELLIVLYVIATLVK